jgi:hypothetical protein
MAKWFYLTDGQQQGPVEAAALKHLATAGQLKRTDKVRREDMAEWYDAKRVKGLFTTDLLQAGTSQVSTATLPKAAGTAAVHEAVPVEQSTAPSPPLRTPVAAPQPADHSQQITDLEQKC